MHNPSEVHILFAQFTTQFSAEKYDALASHLPLNIITEINKYKSWQSKQSRLLGKHLLRIALGRYFDDPKSILSAIQFDPYNRPFIPGDIDFNISHSGNRIIVAICKGARIGIDIEKIRPLDVMKFKNYLQPEEVTQLQKSDNPLNLFFELWTKKESIIKADGRGLFKTIKNIKLANSMGTLEKNQWHLKEIPINQDYKCFLSSSTRINTTLHNI